MNNKEEIVKEKPWNPFEVLLKMRREGPEFRRCCFCLPLRRGLITWGYVKLALDISLIGLLIYLIITFFRVVIIMMAIELSILHIDAVFNVILIVGGHTKNVKILKVAYIYSMFWLGLLFGIFCWYIYIELRFALGLLSYNLGPEIILVITLPGLCLHFVIVFVQIYLILLIRSEVIKLEQQNLEMQFFNPMTAEAQCTMHIASNASRNASYIRGSSTYADNNASNAGLNASNADPSASNADPNASNADPNAFNAGLNASNAGLNASNAGLNAYNANRNGSDADRSIDAFESTSNYERV